MSTKAQRSLKTPRQRWIGQFSNFDASCNRNQPELRLVIMQKPPVRHRVIRTAWADVAAATLECIIGSCSSGAQTTGPNAEAAVSIKASQSPPDTGAANPIHTLSSPPPPSRAATTSDKTEAVSDPATASPAKTGPVEITIIVDHTRVHTGQPLTGHVQVTNTTGARLPLPGLGCSSSLGFLVGLSSATVKFNPPTAAVGCARSYLLAPGNTTVPITIVNTAETGNPPALLGAGAYQTTIILDDFPADTALPPPLNVTLTD